MVKFLLIILISGIGFASVLCLLLVGSIAMVYGNGTITLHWNLYLEGWGEVVALGVIAMFYPFVLWQLMFKMRYNKG